MRIIAGQFRGRRLAPVGKGDATAHLRPTSDRVRESLFNVLSNLNVIVGARVLDLFAGTGALGLEALSRGAGHATFLDNGRAAAKLICANVGLTGSGELTNLIRRDATRLGPCTGAPFDLVFLDPPYKKGLGDSALKSAEAGGWLAPGAVVVWEEGTETSVPAEFCLIDRRRYGDTQISILRYEPKGSDND